MLGLGNSQEKTEQRRFDQQMAAQAEANDGSLAMAMHDPNSVAYDPQVSAMILEQKSRMLHWLIKVVNRNGKEIPYLELSSEHRRYKEPRGEEPFSFLSEDEERKLYNQFDGTLSTILTTADKYNLNLSLCFNDIVNKEQGFLSGSRTTGKPGKLAKSQFVESKANISREIIGAKKKEGGFLGGLFG